MIERIWIFATAPSKADRDLFIKRIEWLQLTDVALFVNGYQHCKFKFSTDYEQRIQDTAYRLSNIGVDIHLVTWIRPIKSYLVDCAMSLRPLCQEVNARSLLFDVEEPWTKNVCGQGCHCGSVTSAQAAALVENNWPFFNWPCQLGVSGITYIPDAVKPVVNRCHYTLPQAYSVSGKTSIVYRPGVTQIEAHKRWRDFRYPWMPYSRKSMVLGLAAWKLNRPNGMSQTQAMQKAIATAESLTDPQVTEVAYWSLSWLLQSKERAEFIRNAGQKVKQGIPQVSSEKELAFG
jgi:hypothetical protein